MTVEDPSENFQRVRDYLDCMLLASTKEFSKAELIHHPAITHQQLATARSRFKINRLQAIRCFDIC